MNQNNPYPSVDSEPLLNQPRQPQQYQSPPPPPLNPYQPVNQNQGLQ